MGQRPSFTLALKADSHINPHTAVQNTHWLEASSPEAGSCMISLEQAVGCLGCCLAFLC